MKNYSKKSNSFLLQPASMSSFRADLREKTLLDISESDICHENVAKDLKFVVIDQTKYVY